MSKVIENLAIGDVVEITLINQDGSPLQIFTGTVDGIHNTPGWKTNEYGRTVSVTTNESVQGEKPGKGFCTWEARISKHQPSVFNQYMRMPHKQQNKFLEKYGYYWHFYSAEFAEDNDDFSGAGDEWILYGPDSCAIEPVAAYRAILGC